MTTGSSASASAGHCVLFNKAQTFWGEGFRHQM